MPVGTEKVIGVPAFEAAEASFDLLIMKVAGTYSPKFERIHFRVNVESFADREAETEATIKLTVNGEGRQSGDIGDMIWNIPESVAYLSSLVTLEPGDLIYTGTPEGVGAVNRGEEIVVHVDGVCDLTLKIA